MRYFRVDLNPVPWAVGPLSVVKRNGKFIPFYGRNSELWHYQEGVKSALQSHILLNELEPPFRLVVFFWRKIEQYESHQARMQMSHEADTTNMIKAFEDALQGVFYKNDKTNIAVEGYIVRQDPEADPHVIVGIEEVALDYPYTKLVDVPPELLNPPVRDDESDEDDKWLSAQDDF